jgi:hypothetical protein
MALAKAELQKTKKGSIHPCPFKSQVKFFPCTKKGGVCSMRPYQKISEAAVTPELPKGKGLVTLCPCRFEQDNLIYAWIGETLLGSSNPVVVGQVGFLEQVGNEPDDERSSDVGRIDNILVQPGSAPIQWCALEIQAVYFSGASMGQEFRALRSTSTDEIPFPEGHRRPDFRSSGPKRLMPQLQIKVPALRRWGKKMAVVVDRSFFEALGPMDHVPEISNADIAWFVVTYEEIGDEYKLKRYDVRFTTLERAVEGLTAGRPVSLQEFETRIRTRLPG